MKVAILTSAHAYHPATKKALETGRYEEYAWLVFKQYEGGHELTILDTREARCNDAVKASALSLVFIQEGLNIWNKYKKSAF